MILVIASSFREHDPQTSLLTSLLQQTKRPFVLLNPLDYKTLLGLRVVNQGLNGTKLFLDDDCINPDTIYLSRTIRSDCIIDFPKNCVYLNIFRQKIDAFIQEILFAFRGSRFFPGKFENINLAESKTSLLELAAGCGLKVPEHTTTCFGRSDGDNYRKALGYPFSISLDNETGEEVAITLTNGKTLENESDLGLPWQWQAEIDCVTQVRCVIVAQKVHCYEADWSKFPGGDLRSIQEEHQVEWTTHELPEEITKKLLLLMERLGLTFACPEFLIDRQGEYIFIDMNPCGDWYGLVSHEDSIEIAGEIVAEL